MKLSELYAYPLKSGSALKFDHAEVEPRGLAGDRRWLAVDPANRFLTGRECPRLVLIRAERHADGLTLRAPEMPDLALPIPAVTSERMKVTIWKDEVDAACAEQEAHDWLSRFLQTSVRLVYMDDRALRPVSMPYGRPGDIVSFADAFPLLLISQESLDGLNVRLPQPLPMLRFRPNLVIAGCTAHVEDSWRRIRIGTIDFDVAKPCTRCVFTTVDPARGAFDESGEPLRTLKTYRRSDRGITFGVNLIPHTTGTLRIDDPVVVLE